MSPRHGSGRKLSSLTSSRALILLAFCTLIGGENLCAQRKEAARTNAASVPVRKLPDTGQLGDYTTTFGEDSDYLINLPSFTVNGDGTVTDNVTALMWQQRDGGEVTFEQAVLYCDTMTLGAHMDWRLPTSHELFGILNHDRLNPALDTSCFKATAAEYWWSSDKRVDDSTRIWVVNAGGGIGPHPKGETVSAGGTRLFHVRAVRDVNAAATLSVRFQDNGDSTVTDLSTDLTWRKYQSPGTMTWDQALNYCESSSLGGYNDWRLPNIKEMQSLNDESLSNPSVDRSFFPGFAAGKFWSSTTQYNASTRAWYVDFLYGIVSYEVKTDGLNVLGVRGSVAIAADTVDEALIPGGEFEMGDHHGFVDPQHPSDELPLHTVKVNSFHMSRTETTNTQASDLLNYALARGRIEVRGNCVFLTGGSDTLCYLNARASYSSIGWDGNTFSVVDFRAAHPVVGIMWSGAAAMCNWFSAAHGLQECYDLSAWTCDFTRNGYRLPTEAEWEYAGRGGQKNPYYNYPWGDDQDVTKANWPGSGDPYETGAYPYTTPVGFYDGTLRQKSTFNWPGSATSYQTSNGVNAFGLYDMAGNVWEFVNDWYGQDYYSVSPYDNPTGPASGFIMPDGKPYRGMRGGNWYNGYTLTTVNDGHSRVSNRNPSYYRGPQDPNHPWYHVGFRVVRNSSAPSETSETRTTAPTEYRLFQNFPNPFNPQTVIRFSVPPSAGRDLVSNGVRDGQLSVVSKVNLRVYDLLGREVAVLVNEEKSAGTYSVSWNAVQHPSGVYFCRLSAGNFAVIRKMVLTK